jgi:hypothetical protein
MNISLFHSIFVYISLFIYIFTRDIRKEIKVNISSKQIIRKLYYLELFLEKLKWLSIMCIFQYIELGKFEAWEFIVLFF